MTTVGILQPSYLPWCGYFEQMAKVDIFIHFDNVPYTRKDWRSRNQILLDHTPHYLSVPTHRRPLGTLINEIEINNTQPWWKKHCLTIENAYRKAPYFQYVAEDVFPILRSAPPLLVDLNISLAQALARTLGITTPTAKASEFEFSYTDKSDRVLQLCKAVGATRLYDGKAAAAFLDIPTFIAEGIDVVFQDYQHNKYPQGSAKFTPYMSVIDMIARCGPEARNLL